MLADPVRPARVLNARPSQTPMLLVLLDAYHLGDPLFIPQLARDVAARKEGLVLVHGSGEAGERAVEALGGVAVQRGGVWAAETDAAVAGVERAARDLNRRIVHEMNEAGAPAVRVMAADRGLVSRGEGGALRAGRTAWLATLVSQSVMPVVASFVAGPGNHFCEADPAETAAALAEALGATAIALLMTGRGTEAGALPLADALATGRFPDAGLAERLVRASRVPVVATLAARLRAPGAPDGTRIEA